jgi:hypothetical protein
LQLKRIGNRKGLSPSFDLALTFLRNVATDAMTDLTKITWKSITVLPSLIGVCLGAALVIALRVNLSLYLGAGLFISMLAAVEIGYLCILLLVNRREGARCNPLVSKR